MFLVGFNLHPSVSSVNLLNRKRNRERAVASGSRLLSDLEMSSSDVPRAGSNTHPGSTSQANEANEFTLDDPDEANKRD